MISAVRVIVGYDNVINVDKENKSRVGIEIRKLFNRLQSQLDESPLKLLISKKRRLLKSIECTKYLEQFYMLKVLYTIRSSSVQLSIKLSIQKCCRNVILL
jgi:hypothetical protein